MRLYFSYQNTLSSERKAFIYARVIRDKAQDMQTYLAYREAMETFAHKSLAESGSTKIMPFSTRSLSPK